MALIKNSDLLRYARAGAEARLQELQQEIRAIQRAFPDLADRRGRRVRSAAGSAASVRKPGRRKWTAAQRQAAAERMRKYWASRRK